MRIEFRDVTTRAQAVSALALLLATIACFAAAAAGAAPTARSSVVATSSLCSVARGVAADIVHSTSIKTTGAVTPTELKLTYGKIAAAEPALLGAASGAIKVDLRQAFAFINLVIADFKKVNWNTVALVQRYGTTLVPRAQKIQRPVKVLDTYFTKTCKMKL